MSHNVETMAYVKDEVPWHGLGFPVNNDLKPKQMLKAAKCDWTVGKQPLFLQSGAVVPGKFGLVRDTDQSVLSVVGATYKPVQNEEAFGFFSEFVEAGSMTMETAGSLYHGRYVWALARVGAGFKLAGGDQVDGYLLMCQPHVHGKSMLFQFTAIRVVCKNTLQMALGADFKGGKSAFRMPHSQKFDEKTIQKAKETLGIVKSQTTAFADAAKLLSKAKAPEDEVEQFFNEVLRFDPKKAKDTRKAKKDGTVREPRLLPYFKAALINAPGQQMPSAEGTWWGAFNAVTYVVDHQAGRERNTALRNAWLGNTASMKRRALDLAIEAAKKK